MTNGSANPAGPPALSDPLRQERLNSWKEIAVYLGRDVRTVRRWEKGQSLPVHRHHHQKAASIYAYKNELDAWWENGQCQLAAGEKPQRLGIAVPWPVPRAVTHAGIKVVAPSRARMHFMAAMATASAVLLIAGYLIWSRMQSRQPMRPIIVAVLPFEDIGPDPQDYLIYALTEETIARLTRVNPQNLRVIARTSAMQYRHTSKSAREIGQELGADYILENSIRHEGGRFRITTQLVRTTDQTHLWAENYDREAAQLLALESEVTNDIAEQVSRQLFPGVTPVPPPGSGRVVDPEAYQSVLKGRYYLSLRTRESLHSSVDAFQAALQKQASYAAAYAGLADAYNMIAFYGFDPSLEAVSNAKVAADKAVTLDDSLAAGHAALGYTEFMWRGDWVTAEREFQRALALDDSYVSAHQWYALYLAAVGRINEAVAQVEYAQTLDPLSPAVHTAFAYVAYLARDYELSIEHANTALQLNPHSAAAHATLGWAYAEQKNYSRAIEELGKAGEISGEVPVYQCALSRAYALAGNAKEGGEVLAHLLHSSRKPTGSGAEIAAAYVALGKPDLALRWLEQSAPGDIQANWLRVDPAFDSLRGEPRFVAVVSRIGSVRI